MISFTHEEIVSACPFKLLSFDMEYRGNELVVAWEYEFCGKTYRYGRSFSSKEFDRVADKQGFKTYELALCERHMKEIVNHQLQ